MILEPASLDCSLQGSKGLTKQICWVAVAVFRIICLFFFRLFWAHVSDWRSLKAEGANPAWTSNKVKSLYFFLQFSHFLILISYSVFRIYFCISNVVNHISSYLWLHSFNGLFFFFESLMNLLATLLYKSEEYVWLWIFGARRRSFLKSYPPFLLW